MDSKFLSTGIIRNLLRFFVVLSAFEMVGQLWWMIHQYLVFAKMAGLSFIPQSLLSWVLIVDFWFSGQPVLGNSAAWTSLLIFVVCLSTLLLESAVSSRQTT